MTNILVRYNVDDFSGDNWKGFNHDIYIETIKIVVRGIVSDAEVEVDNGTVLGVKVWIDPLPDNPWIEEKILEAIDDIPTHDARFYN